MVEEHYNGDTGNRSRLKQAEHGFEGLRGRPTREDCRAGRGGAGGGRPVPGVSCRPEFVTATRGEPFVPRTARGGQTAHSGSHGRSAVRRSASGDQGGLRGIPALARSREIDWLPSGLSGTPRDALADHAGNARPISHGKTKNQFSLVR